MVRQRIRLKIPGRRPADVVQHLLDQHLVVRRRNLGDLEKTPSTTSLAPSVCALPPANSRNHTATRVGRQTDCQGAQQPDRTVCCARRGRRAGGGHKESEGEADEKGGGVSHRSVAPLVCDPRAPSRHRHKDPFNTFVARRGALPCLKPPVGTGQNISISAGCSSGSSGVVQSSDGVCMEYCLKLKFLALTQPESLRSQFSLTEIPYCLPKPVDCTGFRHKRDPSLSQLQPESALGGGLGTH